MYCSNGDYIKKKRVNCFISTKHGNNTGFMKFLQTDHLQYSTTVIMVIAYL